MAILTPDFVTGTLDSAFTSSDATFDFTISKDMQRGDGTYYDLTDDIATGIIQELEVTIEDKNTTKIELLRVSAVADNGATSDGRSKYTCTVEDNGGTKLRGLANTYDGTNSTANVKAANTVATFAKNSKVKVAWNVGAQKRLRAEFTNTTNTFTKARNGSEDVNDVVYLNSSNEAVIGLDGNSEYFGVVVARDGEVVTIARYLASGITVPGNIGDTIYWDDSGETLTATSTGNKAVGIKIDANSISIMPAAGLEIASEAEALAGTDNEKVMSPLRTKQAINAGGITTYGGRSPQNFRTISSGTEDLNIDTQGYFAYFDIPSVIAVNAITFHAAAATVAGTLNIAIYDGSGDTRLLAHVTSTISSSGNVTETLSSELELSKGRYIMAFSPIGSAHIRVGTESYVSYLGVPTGKEVYMGTDTITADTLPSTVDMTAITPTTEMISFRLDN